MKKYSPRNNVEEEVKQKYKAETHEEVVKPVIADYNYGGRQPLQVDCHDEVDRTLEQLSVQLEAVHLDDALLQKMLDEIGTFIAGLQLVSKAMVFGADTRSTHSKGDLKGKIIMQEKDGVTTELVRHKIHLAEDIAVMATSGTRRYNTNVCKQVSEELKAISQKGVLKIDDVDYVFERVMNQSAKEWPVNENLNSGIIYGYYIQTDSSWEPQLRLVVLGKDRKVKFMENDGKKDLALANAKNPHKKMKLSNPLKNCNFRCGWLNQEVVSFLSANYDFYATIEEAVRLVLKCICLVTKGAEKKFRNNENEDAPVGGSAEVYIFYPPGVDIPPLPDLGAVKVTSAMDGRLLILDFGEIKSLPEYH